MEIIEATLKRAPEIALFLSIGLGYLIGKIRFGSFTLGTTAGALIVGIAIGMVFPGLTVSPLIKTIFFALFIYAVGFKTGPQFFHGFNRKMLSQVVLAIIITVSGLICVLGCAKFLKLDEGTAAGLAAGGLTQSAIIATGGDAISRLGLPADKVKELQGNIAIGYAVCYIFGTIGVIFLTRDLAPHILKVNLKTGSEELETKMSGGHAPLKPGEFHSNVLRDVRGYTAASQAEGKTVSEIESTLGGHCTVVKLFREGSEIPVNLSLSLKTSDVVVIAGATNSLLRCRELIGTETDISDIDIIGLSAEVVVIKKDLIGKKLGELDTGKARGVFLRKINRGGKDMPINPGLELHRGDCLTLAGSRDEVRRVSEYIGSLQLPSVRTDLFYCSLGIVVGTLIGLISIEIAEIPVTLGAGGGVLASGLIFGYLRSLQPTFGNFPGAAQTVFSDIGLAGFVVVVGLASGAHALDAIKQSGIALLLAGVIVTVVPTIIGLIAGILMRMQPIVLIGALAGGRSNNAAIGAITDEAESAAPVLGFTVTYAIANVLLTVWGPVVVGIVHTWTSTTSSS